MSVALETIAAEVRFRIIELSNRFNVPHLASSLSCVDILVSAYWGVLDITPQNVGSPRRDRFILSKGHAAPALYAVLERRGIIPRDMLAEFTKVGSPLAEQPGPFCAPGVEWATGSLGHGLGAGIGMMLAASIKSNPVKALVLLSDGECNEGTVWEAAMFAPKHRLGFLTVVVDYNKWQATGRSQEIMQIQPLRDKWESFGWDAVEVDGHNIAALQQAMKRENVTKDSKPLAIIAHTTKGKGVSFMEDDNNWHYRTPSEEEVAQSAQELGIK